jgi:NADH-quinone oxidoreductase subunit L
MVTAGVYLAIRIFPMAGEETRLAFGLVGAISFLSAGLYALVQTDIKKTLAYSTVSQIGLMWMGLGSSASLFHLLTHGIFKAGLFLSAGAIIHYVHQQDKQHQLDAQDIRNLGGLGKKIPFVAFSYTLFAIGLIGLPLSNGFFSKEQLAGYLLEQRNDSAYALVYDGLLLALAIGILLSTLYMLRQVWFLFAGESRSGIHLEKASPNLLQYLPLLILAIGSLWFGVNLNPIHLTKNPLQQAIGLQINETPLFWLGLSIALWLSGALIVARTKQILPRERALFLGDFWTNINKTGIGFAEFVQHKIDQKIDGGITWLVRLQVILAHLLSWFDRWIVDGILVKGSIKISYLWGGVLSKWQSGQVQAYWAWITITFGLFLLYYLI